MAETPPPAQNLTGKDETGKPLAPSVPWYQLPWDFNGTDGSFQSDRDWTGNADLEQQYALDNVRQNAQALQYHKFFNPGGYFRGRDGNVMTDANGQPQAFRHGGDPRAQGNDAFNKAREAWARRDQTARVSRGKAVNSGQANAVMTVPQGAAHWDGRNSFYDANGRQIRAGQGVDANGNTTQTVEYATPGKNGAIAWSTSPGDTTGLTPEQLKQHGVSQFKQQPGVTHVDSSGRGYNQNPATAKANWTPEQQQQAQELDGQIATLGQRMRADPHDTVAGAEWLKLRQQRGSMEGKVYNGKLQDPQAIAARNAAGAQVRQTNQAINTAGAAGAAQAQQDHTVAQQNLSKAQQHVKATTTPAVKPIEPIEKTGSVKSASVQVSYWAKKAAAPRAGMTTGKPPTTTAGAQSGKAAPAAQFQPSIKDFTTRASKGDWSGLWNDYVPLIPQFAQQAMQNMQSAPAQSSTSAATPGSAASVNRAAAPMYANTYTPPAVARASQAAQAIALPAGQTASGTMQRVAPT